MHLEGTRIRVERVQESSIFGMRTYLETPSLRYRLLQREVLSAAHVHIGTKVFYLLQIRTCLDILWHVTGLGHSSQASTHTIGPRKEARRRSDIWQESSR